MIPWLGGQEHPWRSVLNPSTGRPVGQSSWETQILQKPQASAPGPAFSICHLSPFINNHLPQEWHISKAIPSSLALPSSMALGSGGNGMINAEPWASLSLLAPISFPSFIKRPFSLAFPFISPSLVCSRECCDKSWGKKKPGRGIISGPDFSLAYFLSFFF